MGKVYKKMGQKKARVIVEYEHAVLEECAGLADVLGELEASMDPETLHGKLLAETLADARNEAEMKVREAYDEGLRRGLEAGREDFERSVGGAAEALTGAVALIADAHERFLESLEPQVMRLVRGIVERVIGREVRTDTDLVLGSIRRALACLTDRAQITIRVNPMDLAALRNQKAAILDDFDGVVNFTMTGDDGIPAGGCAIDSDTCHVDARIEEILNRVFDDLAD